MRRRWYHLWGNWYLVRVGRKHGFQRNPDGTIKNFKPIPFPAFPPTPQEDADARAEAIRLARQRQ